MSKPFVKWSPAVPIRKPDNIISSHAKDHIAFKPSYEKDPKENMRFLMSNEYMRIWFQEKGAYEKDTYTREQIIKEESKIKRRIIQRMMTFRKPPKNHFIDDYVERKTGVDKLKNQKEQKMKGQKQMKFKPQCLIKTEDPIKVKSVDQVRSKSRHLDKETSKSNKIDKSSKANKNRDEEDSDECDTNNCEIVVCPLSCDCEQAN